MTLDTGCAAHGASSFTPSFPTEFPTEEPCFEPPREPAVNGAVEITTFQLAGVGIEAFMHASAGVDAWLHRQPGFRSRHTTQRDDGRVVDVLMWDSAAQSADAAQRLLRETVCSPLHTLIDQRTVSWNVVPVRHRIGPA